MPELPNSMSRRTVIRIYRGCRRNLSDWRMDAAVTPLTMRNDLEIRVQQFCKQSDLRFLVGGVRKSVVAGISVDTSV